MAYDLIVTHIVRAVGGVSRCFASGVMHGSKKALERELSRAEAGGVGSISSRP
jgi:hypothetical protein